MHFTINSRLIAVRISPRPLFIDGQPCRAKLDRALSIIWLSDQLKRHERRKEVFHELRHLWIDATGHARDDESDAIQAAEMMDLVLEQFMQQGGDTVLESLNPVTEPAPARSGNVPLRDDRCGFCLIPVAPGSIGTDPPVWDANLSGWKTYRGFLCQECGNRVTVWWEGCSPDGAPSGTIIAYPPPRVLTGAEAGEWISGHRDVCRVAVA